MLFSNLGQSFSLLLLLVMLINLASGGTHFCDCSGHQKVFDIAYRTDETFQPRCFFPSAATANSCMISTAGLTSNHSRLLLLAVVANDSDKTVQQMNYYILEHEFNIVPGLMHAVCLLKLRGSPISISVQPVAREANVTSLPVSLRAALIKPGYCARDMLSFHGNCYAVSAVHMSSTDALSKIGGDAELARFGSMSEISQLLAANAARTKKYPYKQPLSLGKPVRINLLLRTADGAQLSAFRNGSRCELRRVASLSPDQFRVLDGVPGAVPGGVPALLCASVRVPSDLLKASEPMIDFGRCDAPMQSLVSFPEAATEGSLLGFVEPCDINQMSAVRRSTMLPSEAAAKQGEANPGLGLSVVAIAAAVAAFTVIVVIFGPYFRARSSRNRAQGNSAQSVELDSQAETQLSDQSSDSPV